jgi:hypothetical protein
MNRLGSLLVGGFGKTPDFTSVLVEPVAVVLDPVLVLDLHVLSVGFGYSLSGQSLILPCGDP